jgi:DNA-binding response OmpR family regulator
VSKPLGLIVEDDADATIIFGKALQAAGFKIKIICSGREALTWLSSGKPDIIVLDVSLPHTSGIDILRNIRADPRLSPIPVIVVTAYPHFVQDLESEVDLVLVKPVSYNQLCDAVTRMHPAAAGVEE